MKKVLLFHRSVGLMQDGRIHKIVNSLDDLGFDVYAFIWTRKNKPASINIGSRSVIKSLSLFFSSNRTPRGGLLISVIELIQECFSAFCLIRSHRPNIIIVQNHRFLPLIFICYFYRLFNPKCYLVWDLRELPPPFLVSNFLANFFFNAALWCCNIVWNVNLPRLNYLLSKFNSLAWHGDIVQNFPSKNFCFNNNFHLPENVDSFLHSRSYFYIQNPVREDRFLLPSLLALSHFRNFAVVITGDIDPKYISHIYKLVDSDYINRNVFFTGGINESQLVPLIDNAFCSIVLYDKSILNNDLCAPNRLYQSICRGVPLIVGNNTTLRTVVDEFECGYVLSDDGRHFTSIISGISKFINNRNYYLSNIASVKKSFTWDKNLHVFRKLLSN